MCSGKVEDAQHLNRLDGNKVPKTCEKMCPWCRGTLRIQCQLGVVRLQNSTEAVTVYGLGEDYDSIMIKAKQIQTVLHQKEICRTGEANNSVLIKTKHVEIIQLCLCQGNNDVFGYKKSSGGDSMPPQFKSA